jgi:GNAT acetyltransferase-like protein
VSSSHEGIAVATKRLTLTPLHPEDADEMAAVLGNEELHEFIGGRPATLDELRARYESLAAGSSKPNEVWLNWIVRRTWDSQPLGTVQATLVNNQEVWTAHVAWVISTPWQKQGSPRKRPERSSTGSTTAVWTKSSPTSIQIIGRRRSSPLEQVSSQPPTKLTASKSGEQP